MKQLISLLFLLWLAGAVFAESKRTHCSDDEEVYFNCLVKGSIKVASVCGLGFSEEKNEPGYIQYRFGPIGHEEFVFPVGRNSGDLQNKFTFSATRSSEYDHYDYDLQFDHLGYAYSVYQTEDRKGDSVRYSASVTVWQLEKQSSGNFQKIAPYAALEKKLLKVFSCTNGNAGQNLSQVNRIVRLITTPGKSSATKYR